MLFFVYIIGIIIYCILPLPLQIPLLILNTLLPDSIPYIDEIMMYGSTVKKMMRAEEIIEWVLEHKFLSFVIAIICFWMIKVLLF